MKKALLIFALHHSHHGWQNGKSEIFGVELMKCAAANKHIPAVRSHYNGDRQPPARGDALYDR